MEDMLSRYRQHPLAEAAGRDSWRRATCGNPVAAQINSYALRPVDAQIWGLAKRSLDFRVYVTDVRGFV
jgi:two-component system sensor histidine kinase CreC